MFYSLVLLTCLGQFEELGNESYEIREKATNLLIDKVCEGDLKLLKEVENALDNGDLETRYRLRSIVQFYYGIGVDIPIWALNEKLRFQDGLDLAKIYYEKAFIKITDGKIPENEQWFSKTPATQATETFILDYLKAGNSREELIKELERSLTLWNSEQAIMKSKIRDVLGYIYLPNKGIPPRIEEREKYLRDHDDFTYGDPYPHEGKIFEMKGY